MGSSDLDAHTLGAPQHKGNQWNHALPFEGKRSKLRMACLSKGMRQRCFSVEVCLSQPSRLIQTAKGAVEIACLGEGPTVLSVHGGPGGCDQGLLMALPLLQAGFHVIAPSRPGYLGTPLSSGVHLEEQADLLAALLDALEHPDPAW